MVEENHTELQAFCRFAPAGFVQNLSLFVSGVEQNQFLCPSSGYLDYQYYHFDMKGNPPIGFRVSWQGAFQ
jgi:hypothetical protein